MDFFITLYYLLGVISGLVAVWFSGDRVVHYAIELASAYRVTSFFMGFVVLALAGAVPELAVAIAAAISGASQVSAGDIIGANFGDVSLVAGLILVVGDRVVLRRVSRIRLLRMLLITGIILAIVFLIGYVSPLLGFCLIGCYFFALWWIWQHKELETLLPDNESMLFSSELAKKKMEGMWARVLLMSKLVLGIIFVLFLSWITIQCAAGLAVSFGLPLEFIGATIFAVGTSLPELVMGISAVRRKEYELALGPALGSILGHSLLVFGILGIFSSSPVTLASLYVEALFMFGGFALIALGLWCKEILSKSLGWVLVAFFVIYLAVVTGSLFF